MNKPRSWRDVFELKSNVLVSLEQVQAATIISGYNFYVWNDDIRSSKTNKIVSTVNELDNLIELSTIPAKHFIESLCENINNEKLTDELFRECARNALPIVEFNTLGDSID